MNLAGNSPKEILYETVLTEEELNAGSILSARDLFNTYVKKGVISECEFDDVRWQFYDEYSNVGIVFNYSKLQYKQTFEPILGISLEQFVQYQKTYIILTLGKRVLVTLQKIINDMKKFIKNGLDYNQESCINYTTPYHLIEFLSMIPCVSHSERDDIISILEEIAENNYRDQTMRRRALSQFQSYFRFDQLLAEYWNCDISKEERLFFYPIYLWWKITGVIPLRPREFLLIPRDCLVIDKNGKTQIRLRRNRLKGSGGKVQYSIDQDYIEVLYIIPEWLKLEIENYLNLTESYESNQLRTLFRTEPHFARFGQPKHKNNRFYTYINLSCCLRCFYQDIVFQKMNYHVFKNAVNKDYSLNDNEIEYIYLGDTRHIAMINIIAEGGTPTMAMLLAGHADIDISSHYYANLSNMIECRTYMKYKALLEKNTEYAFGINYYPQAHRIDDRRYIELENRGRCYSPAFNEGSISDCRKVQGANGEIGYCFSCPYYRKNQMAYYLDDDDIYKSKINEEVGFFIKHLERYRRRMGNEEEVKTAYMRLEASSGQYETYYMQKLLNNWEKKRSSGNGTSKKKYGRNNTFNQ